VEHSVVDTKHTSRAEAEDAMLDDDGGGAELVYLTFVIKLIPHLCAKRFFAIRG
jgi:hypothetical protein